MALRMWPLAIGLLLATPAVRSIPLLADAALEYSPFGSDNTAVGKGALQILFNGFQNTAIAAGAMDLISNSFNGTALGWGAMDKLEEGQGNLPVLVLRPCSMPRVEAITLSHSGFEALEASDRFGRRCCRRSWRTDRDR